MSQPVSYAERQQIGLADRYSSVSMSDLFSSVKVDIRSAAYASRQEELDIYARGAFSKVGTLFCVCSFVRVCLCELQTLKFDTHVYISKHS